MASGKHEAQWFIFSFKTCVREEFLNGEHVVSIFLEREKAYDTTWKYGIIKRLHDMYLRGR